MYLAIPTKSTRKCAVMQGPVDYILRITCELNSTSEGLYDVGDMAGIIHQPCHDAVDDQQLEGLLGHLGGERHQRGAHLHAGPHTAFPLQLNLYLNHGYTHTLVHYEQTVRDTSLHGAREASRALRTYEWLSRTERGEGKMYDG